MRRVGASESGMRLTHRFAIRLADATEDLAQWPFAPCFTSLRTIQSDSGEASAAAALGLSCAGQAGRLDVSGWGRIADRTPTSWWITVL